MSAIRIIAAIVVIVLTACSEPQLTFDPDPAKGSIHTVDWPGVYQGTFPCPSCDGMKTTLTLIPPNQYKISTEHLGQTPLPFKNGGIFHWDKTGNIIYLDRGQIYHVVDGKMYLLNVESQRIRGDDEEKYIVNKIADLPNKSSIRSDTSNQSSHAKD
ncbi:copper resistance protein NlpE [Shewanella sp. KT0246]|uniref:copper resistance protein NlpE n=1 Tax=Shewanella sp. KT0246 TaxID=2815912 RepID=UPI001BBD3423|nr:copper resistance protein NlpE [Shewanella sp. KT0246]GIU02425.1 copper resistance protein [Shewanella sp. KT0246]